MKLCACSVHGSDILDVDASHDNARIASAGLDRKVFITDVASGRIIRKIRAHDDKVNGSLLRPTSSVSIH